MMKKFAACLVLPDGGPPCRRRPNADRQPAARPILLLPPPPREDRYIGYYYPADLDRDLRITMQTIAGAARAQRIQFVPSSPRALIQSAYPCPIAVFAKGEKADRIIIFACRGELNTVYRMRALLANMTTMSRLSPFFQERTGRRRHLLRHL